MVQVKEILLVVFVGVGAGCLVGFHTVERLGENHGRQTNFFAPILLPITSCQAKSFGASLRPEKREKKKQPRNFKYPEPKVPNLVFEGKGLILFFF